MIVMQIVIIPQIKYKQLKTNIMQAVRNGIYGQIQELNESKLGELLEDPEVDKVEVFNGTKENINKRKKMIGKKYKVSKAYKKAPSVKSKKK